MIKVYTKMAFAGQTLHLPIVGEVTLDKEAAIEVKDEQTANWLIDVTKGSNSFHKTKAEANVNVKKKEIAVNNETVKPKPARQRLGELLQEVGVTQVRQWIDEVFPPAPQELTPPVVEEKKNEGKESSEEDESTSNEDQITNAEDLIEAVNSCDNKEELLSLIELIPGVKKKDTKNKEAEELKKFLVDHINSAVKK